MPASTNPEDSVSLTSTIDLAEERPPMNARKLNGCLLWLFALKDSHAEPEKGAK